MWFRPHPWSMCRLELLVRLVPLPPITYNFYLRKLRFLRKVRKSMSFKMILNSHNSLFAHIFFNSHFIRYQRLKEQSASSYGLPVNTFQPSSKSPQKLISRCFLPENQYSILNYSAWRKWRLRRNGGEASPPFPPLSPHVIFISHEFLRFSVFSRIVQCEEELAIAKEGVSAFWYTLFFFVLSSLEFPRHRITYYLAGYIDVRHEWFFDTCLLVFLYPLLKLAGYIHNHKNHNQDDR